MSGNRLLIVGASGRAAAASAIRAGFEPFVIDLFADADTKRLCPVLKCEMADYPVGLVRLAEQAPPGPWMYTGGLENHPEVVGAISETRELWGNGPEVLRRVRDPFGLFGCLSAFDSATLTVHPSIGPMPGDRRFLRKPTRGAGGLGVRFATPDDWDGGIDRTDYVMQEFVPGRSMSAAFRRDAGDKRPRFVGLSDQLVGCEWLHAKPFAYCGSVVTHPNLGPDPRPVAYWLTTHYELTGVWGMDYILPDRGRPHPVDVNPRYPASAEVYEYATGVPALKSSAESYPTRPVGKAIYYAPHRLTFPASGPWDESLRRCTDVWRRPDFADIPDPHAVIEPGHPVLTLLADGATEAAVLDTLKEQAAEMDRLFVRPR